MLTRRQFAAGASACAVAALQPWPALPQTPSTGPPPPPPQVDAAAQAFMHRYKVPALSLAYGRGPRILLAQAYGYADTRTHQPATPQNLFRIASLSKAITSAAIFTLLEAGKLHLTDPVFGPGGLLRSFKAASPQLQAITVHHLLTHTAGGWGNEQNDPMFHNRDRTRSAFLQHTLEQYPLTAAPGTVYAYSNFGYFVLGRLIEQLSGQPYEVYVQAHVLQPLGITDMRLGHSQTAPGEVHYYSQSTADPYNVPIDLHDANGGWLATATDLVHFALGVFAAEDNSTQALLTRASLAQLTATTAANPRYACGWGVSPDGDYTHTGALPGTNAVLMHRHDGLAWCLLANTQQEHASMEDDLRELGWVTARLLPPRDPRAPGV